MFNLDMLNLFIM